MTRLVSFLFAVGTLVVLTARPAAAQGPGTGGPQPGGPAEPTAVPIDGGASLLLASGASYALHRLRQRRTRPTR